MARKAKRKFDPSPRQETPITPFIARGIKEISSPYKPAATPPSCTRTTLPFESKSAEYEEKAGQVYALNMDKPCIWFSLAAWRRFLRASSQLDVEMAFYGIAASPVNPLYIHDIGIFPQRSNCVHWEAEDDATIMNHILKWGDREIPVERCARILCHTHPGMGPSPSGTDETVFEKVFENTPWSVMCILSTGMGHFPTPNNSYARLKVNGIVPLSLEVPVRIDMTSRLPSGDAWGPDGWESSIDEDLKMVTRERVLWTGGNTPAQKENWGGHYPGFVDELSSALGVSPDDLDEEDWKEAYGDLLDSAY